MPCPGFELEFLSNNDYLPEVVGTVQQVHCTGGDYFDGD